MSHANQSKASDAVTVTLDSLRTEAEELRRQIGSENMNQSGVIASRRLDEALLRLDLAAGRRRESGSSISSTRVKVSQAKSSPRRPRSIHSAPVNDLELDDSIAQSSSVWLEPTEQRETRYRLDPSPESSSPPKSHVKPSPPIERTSLDAHTPPSIATPASTGQQDSAEATPASLNTFVDLFATPIDVMSSPGSINHDHTEHEQIVTSVPESKWKPTVGTQEPAEAIEQDENASEPPDVVGLENTVQAELDIDPGPITPSDVIEPAPEVTQPTPRVGEAADGVTDEMHAEETDAPAEIAQQLRPFQATWQVDEFIVPSTVDELFLAGSVAEQLAARLAAARSDGLHTIAVTSPKPGEGRSTVAMGMALSVAFTGLRVALVDADPMGVKLATDLQLDLENSWIDAIRTDLPLEESAVFSQADSLTLIPLLESDAELPMNVNELRRLLTHLKASFDLVIVDCGASAVSEVALCDTALIVRDVHRTKALEVETLAMSLRRNGLQGVGVVENFCPK